MENNKVYIMKKKTTKNKKIIIQEVAKKFSRDKITYHFIDSENKINVRSKVVFKKQDKFVIYPFYIDKKTRKIKPKYRKIQSFTFEGLKNKLPSGFIKDASKGYGVTRFLKPLRKFIEDSLDVRDVEITKKNKSNLAGYKLILHFEDFENIRKSLASINQEYGEQNKIFLNNYFIKVLPSKFKAREEEYQKGAISRILKQHDSIEKDLSSEDKNALLRLFKKLSINQKDIFEKQVLVSTKDKIEQKFIEDILKEFEMALSLKHVKEDKWQYFFTDNAWIFSQLFAYPAVLFKDKAYVGGKTIEDTEGKIVDFLYANKLTRNSALIEIKKHTTKLLSKKPYRGTDVFSMDRELSGAISQALDQKETYCKTFDSIRGEDNISSFNPKCIIIIGKISDLNKKQFKAFELMRSNFKDLEIIAFDELYERIKSILSIFKKKDSPAG